jgi:hypothetical protein
MIEVAGVMTPAELVVLFSGYVIAFALVWLTGLIERFEESVPKAAKREKAEHDDDDDESSSSSEFDEEYDERVDGQEYKWNVGAFFGINRQQKRA